MKGSVLIRQEINLLNRPLAIETPTVSLTCVLLCSLLSLMAFGITSYYQNQSLMLIQYDIEKIEKKNIFNQQLAQSPSNIEAYQSQLTGLEERLLSKYQLWANYKQITDAGKDGFSQYFYHIASLANEYLSLYQISISDRGNHLALKGYASKAEEIPSYINALKSQEALSRVVFGNLSIEKIENHSVLMFSLDKQESSDKDVGSPDNKKINISDILKVPLADIEILNKEKYGRRHMSQSSPVLISER